MQMALYMPWKEWFQAGNKQKQLRNTIKAGAYQRFSIYTVEQPDDF